MAGIGARYLVAARIKNEVMGQPIEYEAGKILGRAISMDVTFEKAETDIHVDDVLGERLDVIIGGSVRLNVAELLPEIKAEFFGLKRKGTEGNYRYIQTAETSPNCGVGIIQEQIYKGKVTYYAVWIYKTQFAPSGMNFRTRGRQTEFQTADVSGSMFGVYQDEDMIAEYHAEGYFDKSGEAVAWLNSMANITAPVAV